MTNQATARTASALPPTFKALPPDHVERWRYPGHFVNAGEKAAIDRAMETYGTCARCGRPTYDGSQHVNRCTIPAGFEMQGKYVRLDSASIGDPWQCGPCAVLELEARNLLDQGTEHPLGPEAAAVALEVDRRRFLAGHTSVSRKHVQRSVPAHVTLVGASPAHWWGVWLGVVMTVVTCLMAGAAAGFVAAVQLMERGLL